MGFHEVSCYSLALSSCSTSLQTNPLSSWNQRYQNETSSMLEQLNTRLRDIDERITIHRQQSVISNVSSNPSSNGSYSYRSSPPPSLSHTHSIPQATPPPLQQTPSFGETTAGQHISPQYHTQRPSINPVPHSHPQQQQQFSSQNNLAYTQPMQQPFQQQHIYQQPQQPPNYIDNSFRNSSYSTAPNSQFAGWAWNGGPSGHHSFEDENAVPPKPHLWELNSR